MKRIIFLLTLLALLIGSSLSAKEKTLGFSISLHEYQIRENTLTNIRHRGLNLSYGINYNILKEEQIKALKFGLSYNKIKSRYENDRLSFAVNPSLSYSLVKKIKDLKNDLKYYVGGSVGWDLTVSHFEDWDESHVNWLNQYYISLNQKFNYLISSRSNLYLELEIPILLYLSRPPERFLFKEVDPDLFSLLGDFHQDMRITTIHEHLQTDIQFKYTFKNSDKLTSGYFWKFRLLKNDVHDSEEIFIITHSFGFELIF